MRQTGAGAPVFVLAHGFGCDQTVWNDVAPILARVGRVIAFDLAGSGAADPAIYDRARHVRLDGYAEDVVGLLDDLALGPVVFVGHSVSGMIGALGAIARPDLFASLLMIGPSACCLNLDGHQGGFDRRGIEELLALLDSNFKGFANSFAPIATGNPDRPELVEGLARTFCRNDPEIASAFARVTFFSDCRAMLGRVCTPTVVMQYHDDPIAPEPAIRTVVDGIAGSRHLRLDAAGHCPHISHPAETARAILAAAPSTDGGSGTHA